MAKRTIAATKLQAGDEVVTVQVITDNQNVVLQTREGYFLRFAADEVSEKKKGAIGVRGIRLKKKDELEHAYLFEEGYGDQSNIRGKRGESEPLKDGKAGRKRHQDQRIKQKEKQKEGFQMIQDIAPKIYKNEYQPQLPGPRRSSALL